MIIGSFVASSTLRPQHCVSCRREVPANFGTTDQTNQIIKLNCQYFTSNGFCHSTDIFVHLNEFFFLIFMLFIICVFILIVLDFGQDTCTLRSSRWRPHAASWSTTKTNATGSLGKRQLASFSKLVNGCCLGAVCSVNKRHD